MGFLLRFIAEVFKIACVDMNGDSIEFHGSSTATLMRLGLTVALLTMLIPRATATEARRQYGPSSPMTPLIVSEIMYRPWAITTNNGEFIELFNTEPFSCDVSGWRLSGDIDYTFATGTVIKALSYFVVAKDPAFIRQTYGITNVMGPYSNSLPNGVGTVRLRNRQDAVLLEVEYSDSYPWPAAANGAGHSLVLAKPDYGEGDVLAWRASAAIYGNPGTNNVALTNAQTKVVINEFLAHTDPPLVDYIELFNPGAISVDMSGCYLSDDPATNKYRIPNGTVIGPRGFALFYQTNGFGFLMDPGGESVYLVASSQSHVIDAIKYPAQINAVSSGRHPDGAPGFQMLSSRTAGTSNSVPYRSDIVINEIMYSPISGSDDDAYVELYNRGTGSVDMSYWRFTEGIDVMMPPGTVIPSNGYVVVAKNVTNLLAKYGTLNTTNTVGNYGGKLSGRGERLVFSKPDDPALPYQDFVTVDEVTYSDGWGTWSDGGGSSLELKDPRSDNRLGMNWTDSDESQKASWCLITNTGVLDLGTNSADQLQILLTDAGECLLDSVDVHKGGGANLISNGSFESGTSGWRIGDLQGNHASSVVKNGGAYDSANSLHVQAHGRGDNSVNCLRYNLSPSLNAGDTGTITGWFRWLRGNPVVVMRLRYNHLEASGVLQVPSNLGTPGQPNSGVTSNAPPAVWDVSHSPILPAAGANVLVTARVNDPDAISSVLLKYRIDPSSTIATTAMTDSGTGGDAAAGDGLYSALIPGQPATKLVAFHITAGDNAIPQAWSAFPRGAQTNECLVLFGQSPTGGVFGIYRFWITEATGQTWANRQIQSDEYLGGTLVYGDYRVIYNASGRYSGSPWARQERVAPEPSKKSCVFRVPEDDRLLGENGFNMHATESETTYQREKLTYWMIEQLDLPTLGTRYVSFFVNNTPSEGPIRLVVQQANGNSMSAWFPNAGEGERHKVDAWFEFDDGQNTPAGDVRNVFRTGGDEGATLENFTTTGGVKKKAKYRWTFWKEPGPAQPDDDYGGIYTLVDAMNGDISGADYAARVPMLVDYQNWAGVFAVRHFTCTWDSYGSNIGKNSHIFKPRSGPWKMTFWDMSQALGANSTPWFKNSEPSAALFANTEDPVIGNKFYQHPPFRRAFLSLIKEAVNGPLNYTVCGPRMNEYYTVLTNNGIAAKSPEEDTGQTSGYPPQLRTWIETRRTNLLAQLAPVEVGFAITNNNGAPFSTPQTSVKLGGTAPVEIAALTANGVSCAATFPTVTSWMIEVPLVQGPNNITVAGLDRRNNVVTQDTIEVTCTGTNVSPSGWLVINEIMYHPTNSHAEFVEIVNRSSSHNFNLSGYRLNGLDFVFGGTIIHTGEYIVVTRNRATYGATYKNAAAVVGEFSGSLQGGGETIQLLMPLTTNTWQVLDEVKYDDDPPWPAKADGGGPSLQLIDATRDNNRVGNWAVGASVLYTPGAPNSVTGSLPAFDQIWISEVMPSNTASFKDNAGEYEPWAELFNSGSNSVNLFTGGYYLTDSYTNLTKWLFPSGWSVTNNGRLLVWCDNDLGQTTATNLHAGFIMNSASGSVALVRVSGGATVVVDYVNYDLVGAGESYGRYPDGTGATLQVFHYPTPGSANNPASDAVDVHINEWMARNSSTIADPADGDLDDWFELYNAGSAAVDLTGFRLAGSVAATNSYTIPGGYTIGARSFKLIWADSETGQNGAGRDLHVDFKLNRDGDAIGLYAPDGTLVDGVVFGEQFQDVSEGRWPNGAADIYPMTPSTPGASNSVLLVTSLPPPGPSGFNIAWAAQSGRLYRILGTTNLVATNWLTLSVVTASAPAVMFTDTNAATFRQRYYRLEREP